MSKHQDAPRPEALYLRILHARIQTGNIRVPAFQRGFVWEEKQILEVLESVYRGFPIGSLLLWRVEKKELKVDRSDDLPLPELEEHYPTSYILDGLQRLTTLYAAFHENGDRRFQLMFDLREEQFISIASSDDILESGIRLFDIFDPRAMLGAQKRLLELNDGATLIDASLRLQAAFQNYILPTVTIDGREVEEVVEIFERVNSTGTKLSTVDFMRAVTWSDDFDLTTEIDNMSMAAQDLGFEVPDETFVKLLGIGAGLAPTSESLIGLKAMSATDLQKAQTAAANGLEQALKLLLTEKILCYDYVPYEGQLLVVVAAFLEEPSLSARYQQQLISWLRQTSLVESLRGKPDHYVQRAINSTITALRSNEDIPIVRMSLSAEDLMERRFTVRKAVSAALVTFFAHNTPRDLKTGAIIETEIFMRNFESSHFGVVLTRDSVSMALGKDMSSARVLANTFIVTDESRSSLAHNPKEVLNKATKDALDSQFVSQAALDALNSGDNINFLKERADCLLKGLAAFTS